MSVHYYDVVRQSCDVEQALNVTYHDTLESLLKVSDCVSLHAPLNQHTRHLINRYNLRMMKPGARLINTARGEVVDEEVLIQALGNGSLSAAGLDVHYHEPQVSPKLAVMENVTLTTHIAGGALNTRINFELSAMKNILATVGGQGKLIGQPSTPVNAKQVLEYLKAQP
ncbi:D-isomer specific 2-hydroxyacid dehydrogenase [Aspergillus navahoensis]